MDLQQAEKKTFLLICKMLKDENYISSDFFHIDEVIANEHVEIIDLNYLNLIYKKEKTYTNY